MSVEDRRDEQASCQHQSLAGQGTIGGPGASEPACTEGPPINGDNGKFVVIFDFRIPACTRTDSRTEPVVISVALPTAMKRILSRLLNWADTDGRGDPTLGSARLKNPSPNPNADEPSPCDRIDSERSSECKRVPSRDAELALTTLVQIRNEAAQQRMAKQAWRSKCDWFDKSVLGRRCKDAQELIDELLELGFIEGRNRGIRNGLRQYHATDAAVQFLQVR